MSNGEKEEEEERRKKWWWWWWLWWCLGMEVRVGGRARTTSAGGWAEPGPDDADSAQAGREKKKSKARPDGREADAPERRVRTTQKTRHSPAAAASTC